MTWTWTLRCLTVQCLPARARATSSPTSSTSSPAHLEYVSPTGTGALHARRALPASRGPVPVEPHRGRTPSTIHTLVWWSRPDHPVPRRTIGVAPNLVFWLAVALATVLGAAGLALASRWALAVSPVQGCEGACAGRRRSSARSRSSSGRGRTTTRPCSGRHSSGSPTSSRSTSTTSPRRRARSRGRRRRRRRRTCEEISETAGIQTPQRGARAVRGTTLARRGATRLGDLAQLSAPAKRTTVVRVGLALALAATLAGAVLLARSAGSGRAAVLPGRREDRCRRARHVGERRRARPSSESGPSCAASSGGPADGARHVLRRRPTSCCRRTPRRVRCRSSCASSRPSASTRARRSSGRAHGASSAAEPGSRPGSWRA